MSERVRIWDILLIVALVAACFAVFFFPRNRGLVATVCVDGRVKAVMSLSEDASVVLEDGTVILVENGAVRVESSTCPDHLCESMGSVQNAGQSILCLPNRISVVLSGEGADAYVG